MKRGFIGKISLMLNKAFKMDSKESFFFFSSTFTIFLVSGLILGFKWFYEGLSLKEDFISSYRMVGILEEDLSEEDLKRILTEVQQVEGVKSVTHLKKEEVTNFVSEFIDLGKMKRFVPDVIEIYIDEKWIENVEKIKMIEEKIKKVGGIEFLDSAKENVESTIRFIKYVKRGGRFFIMMLSIGGILIIYNFIHLTIYSIHKKIEIMKFVGASPEFIKIPLIIRGIAAGILGSSSSCIFMKSVLHSEVFLKEFLYLLLYSVFAGGFGSYLALRSKKV